jgi:hypothetical protein
LSKRITAGCLLLVMLWWAAPAAGQHTVDPPGETRSESYRLPNVHINIYEDLLNAVLASTAHTRAPFNEVILGSRYHGISTTDSSFSLRTEPAEDGVALTLLWQATVVSRSSSTTQRTEVSSRSTTRITATKELSRGVDGWQVEPASVRATSRSRITNLKVRRLLGRRIARRRAYQQGPRVDRSVARRTEQRTRREFDRQIDTLLANMQEDFDRRVLQPLAERGQLLNLVGQRSTADAVELALQQADTRQDVVTHSLTALPSERAAADLSISLHESAFNNLATGMLAGKQVREDQLAEQLTRLLGQAPAGLQPSDPDKLWTIHFHQVDPLRVEFAAGVVTVTLVTQSFTVGSQVIPGARLKVAYELNVEDARLHGVRQGRIEIVPLDANEETPQVGVRYQVFRSMLRRRFERAFPAEFTWDQLTLPANRPEQAALSFAHCQATNEWLQLDCTLPQPQAENKLAQRSNNR